jgi:hypothetical protein
MIIAMVTVRVVQVAIDEVVDVVSVRNGWVSASGAVDMVGIVSGTAVVRGAHCGVVLIDVDAVLIDVVLMGMVQVTIDEVVDMISVRHRFVTTIRAVNVAGIMSAASVSGGA